MPSVDTGRRFGRWVKPISMPSSITIDRYSVPSRVLLLNPLVAARRSALSHSWREPSDPPKRLSWVRQPGAETT